MEQVLFTTLKTVSGKLLGIATLNAEKSLNALTFDMVRLLAQQLRQWQQDSQIAAVILEAKGEKAFCAGGDVRAIYYAQQCHPGSFTCEAERFFEEEYRLDYLIHTYGKPVLLWGDGIVMGGGLGLMMGASHRIVTERSRIAMPEVTIGLYPDVGASYFLRRLPGKTGLFLGLTAYNLNAADARYCGFANHFLASSDKQRLFDAMTTLNWGGNHTLNHQKLHDLLTMLAANCSEHSGNSRLKAHQSLLDELMSGELPQIVEKMQRLVSELTWLDKARNTMLSGSPLSWALAWEQAHLGKSLTLADCFRMELGWSLNCCAIGDFCEGVRALLVDKDRSPQWRYGKGQLAPPDVLAALLADPFSHDHPLADL
ncbi:enoyl-CoA hydratase/isomerase family protein [Shewanella yunxiaonensis]|uniref:enoyl-CoA hydratase/isomerase family protein n=1 Tax=Shewanella yunxiaonensis TaxID=2829809 RepID=UPI001E39D0EE|nr:enoyl-CoA hydratase/isomerase family protein [Shewanella yunxiaonensis]